MLRLSSSITTSSSSSTATKMPPQPSQKHKRLLTNPNSSSSSSTPFLCKHSPSATLDILILTLVLFSCTFLIISSSTYIFTSITHLLHFHSSSFHKFPALYILGFLTFFTISIVFIEIWFSRRSRKCEKNGCKGLKNALEFDIKLESGEECSKFKSGLKLKEIDSLPWKGGTETNPDYECLRSELRKMAPLNGRAVLLFRAKCGCPIAKLEAWGAKRAARRNKKYLTAPVPSAAGNKH